MTRHSWKDSEPYTLTVSLVSLKLLSDLIQTQCLQNGGSFEIV